MANFRDKSPETAFALQKYYLLQTQQEDLHRRLSLSTTSTTSSTTPPSTSTYTQSIPSSPTKFYSSSRRRRSSSFSTSSPQSLDNEHEQKLCAVNRQIKTTLTELLNCEGVKHDDGLRMWVQSRLMSAEQELKSARRRRSSVAVEDVEAVRSHLEQTLSRGA